MRRASDSVNTEQSVMSVALPVTLLAPRQAKDWRETMVLLFSSSCNQSTMPVILLNITVDGGDCADYDGGNSADADNKERCLQCTDCTVLNERRSVMATIAGRAVEQTWSLQL